MKKCLLFLLTVILLVGALCLPASAAKASASLTGPDVVRAGDTITVTFKINGSGIYGVSGTLQYDSSQLTLTGTSQKIASPWMLEFNDNEFVAYDNNLENPINSNTSIFTATFKVKSNLAIGSEIVISVVNLTTSDGEEDTEAGSVSYVAAIAAPKSTDNTLKRLTVGNATLSPAFDPQITDYTASVPFEVSKLELTYQVNDSKAKVSVNNPALTADATTTVTVTVTAENGSIRIYTIRVTRAKDPNYQPSSNNTLSGLAVDGFTLSPVFTPDNDRYILWLPYETERVTVRGTPADRLATVEVVGGDYLVAGRDNEIRVICTAENGKQKTYYITAKRAAAHGQDPLPQPETYTVFWVVDGHVTAETYEAGAMPSFSGRTDKSADDYYAYTFAGWHQQIKPVNEDVIYLATYNKTPIRRPDDPGATTQPTTPNTTNPVGSQGGQTVEQIEGVSIVTAVLLAMACTVGGLLGGIILRKKKTR